MSLRPDADSEHSAALLDKLESRWRPLLPGISLLTELDIDRATIAEAAGAFGRLYRESSAQDRSTLLLQWPACVAVTMSGVAAHDYSEGTFWRYWGEAIGHQPHLSQQDSKVWGEVFRSALTTFRLPLFDESSLKYVGPILMHAGIPTYCLENFFKLLLHRRAQDPRL